MRIAIRCCARRWAMLLRARSASAISRLVRSVIRGSICISRIFVAVILLRRTLNPPFSRSLALLVESSEVVDM